QRPGDDDRDPPPYRLAVEGTIRLVRGNRALALVEHFHVAAEGHRGDDPLGLILADSLDQERSSETNRKAQDLHAAQAGHEIVAVLVHHDQHAERDDEGDEGVEETHAAWASTRAAAKRRAWSSAASTSPRSVPGRAGSAA